MAEESKIYIDPGHGGTDPGGVGNGLKEKDLVLTMAKAAKAYLEKNYEGHTVRLSRTGDTFPSLSDRTKDANKWGADCFVSLHTNAGGGKGYETFVYTSASANSKKLSDALHKEILAVMRKYDKNIADRGQKKANYAVIRESDMPAALTETGFIDSSVDAKLLKNPKFLKEAGEAHAIAIANYLKLKKKVVAEAAAKAPVKKVTKPAETKKPAVKKPVYRLVVDGEQLGAYSDVQNISEKLVETVNMYIGDKEEKSTKAKKLYIEIEKV